MTSCPMRNTGSGNRCLQSLQFAPLTKSSHSGLKTAASNIVRSSIDPALLIKIYPCPASQRRLNSVSAKGIKSAEFSNGKYKWNPLPSPVSCFPSRSDMQLDVLGVCHVGSLAKSGTSLIMMSINSSGDNDFCPGFGSWSNMARQAVSCGYAKCFLLRLSW